MLNGIITIAAIAIVLCYGGIYTMTLEWSFDITPWSASVHLDPVFIAWDESNTIPGSAFAFGPVIVAEERWRGSERETYILHHERNHVKQWYAIGWLMWPAQWFGVLDIEADYPDNFRPNWSDPHEHDRHMWIPTGWPHWGHFLTFEVRLGS